MFEDSANADSALDEQLVAYLDGELDAEASSRVEGLLASDAEARRKLQELDRTWELLDELDSPQVAERFAQSTLEMVTLAAAEDVKQSRTGLLWTFAIAGGSLLAAGLAGFLSVALLAPDPDRELIRDLPVLEKLDQYRQIDDIELQIDDIELLRWISRAGLFVEEDSDEQE